MESQKIHSENGIVVGNVTKKQTVRNPLARLLVKGFDDRVGAILTRLAPERILEVGCGEGAVVNLALENTSAKIVATDISVKVIGEARESISDERVVFETVSIYDIPETEEHQADLVVCCEVLEHLESPLDGLRKLHALTTSRCILSVPREPIWRMLNIARGAYISDLGNTPGHIQHWNKTEFIKFVSSQFTVEEVYAPLPWTIVVCKKSKPQKTNLSNHGLCAHACFTGLYCHTISRTHFQTCRSTYQPANRQGTGSRQPPLRWPVRTHRRGLAYPPQYSSKGCAAISTLLFIYSRTSIAKYLPGNFGHLAGRHFMAGRFSIKHTVIGAASMLEILCQVSAALLICLWAKLPIAPRISPELGLLLSVCVLVLLPMAFIRFGGNAVTAFREIRLKSLYVAIGLACIIDIAFFLCNGSLIYYIAMAAGLPMTTGLPTFISVYAVAWFLGLVTPGAPAGIGIREAVIVGMLGSVMPESASLVLALLFRLATSIGELLFLHPVSCHSLTKILNINHPSQNETHHPNTLLQRRKDTGHHAQGTAARGRRFRHGRMADHRRRLHR